MNAPTRRFPPRRLLAAAGFILASLALGASPLAPVASDPGGRMPPGAEIDTLAIAKFLSHPLPAPAGESSRGPTRWGPGHCAHCHF